MVYGIWYMVYGIWYMVYGIWYIVPILVCLCCSMYGICRDWYVHGYLEVPMLVWVHVGIY